MHEAQRYLLKVPFSQTPKGQALRCSSRSHNHLRCSSKVGSRHHRSRVGSLTTRAQHLGPLLPFHQFRRSGDQHLVACVIDSHSMLAATRAWTHAKILQILLPLGRGYSDPQGVSSVLKRQRIVARRGNVQNVVIFDQKEAV